MHEYEDGIFIVVVVCLNKNVINIHEHSINIQSHPFNFEWKKDHTRFKLLRRINMGVATQNRSCIDIIPQFTAVVFGLSACSTQ